jgi:hypothetical protein
MENSEINPPPDINGPGEQTFRENAIQRLVNEHNDLEELQLNRWLELLSDSDPHARVMATTAVWTMMDVRDQRKRLANREGIVDTIRDI